MKKRITAFLGVVLILLTATGCNVFRSEYPDYDVSGYIKALLDSSYLGQNEELIDITNQSEEKANENVNLTIDNGVIYFCNAFQIGDRASESQKNEIREIVKSAYALSKYSVAEKQETTSGYAVNVEIEPLSVFTDILPQAEELRLNKEALMNQAGLEIPFTEDTASEEEQDLSDEFDSDESIDDEIDSETNTSEIDEETLFSAYIDEVIKMSKAKINEPPVYDRKVTVKMDILRTDKGELKLNTVQLQEIDEKVVLFSPLAQSTVTSES